MCTYPMHQCSDAQALAILDVQNQHCISDTVLLTYEQCPHKAAGGDGGKKDDLQMCSSNLRPLWDFCSVESK